MSNRMLRAGSSDRKPARRWKGREVVGLRNASAPIRPQRDHNENVFGNNY